MSEITKYLTTNYLEVLGIITTLICVWLNTKQNIWGWPWAILASAIYGFVYFQAKLYSDMELQIVFILISAYGWWQWLYGSNEKDNLPVTATPSKYYLILTAILVAFAGVSGYLHGKYTDASFPYFDSTLTAISLIAQWLLARKYIENWILWMVANLGYIVMYFSKNLLGTSILYFLLLGLAIMGYLEWRKSLIVKHN
jgi:nicotinamide mononucleotide transporter